MTYSGDAARRAAGNDPCDAIVPRWDAPARVHAWSTTRRGGTSAGPWGLEDGSAGGLNLGARCGDDPAAVARNRARVAHAAGAEPVWLEQVHGVDVHRVLDGGRVRPGSEPRADASVTNVPGVVLAVLTADCLPVVFADAHASVVGVAHAGWRGLAAGVLERTIEALRPLAERDGDVLAWLGPSIGPDAFEVGDEVRERFCDVDGACREAFVAAAQPGKWFADLHALARLRLGRVGVHRVHCVHGSLRCTVREPRHFYSYRRDGTCGRMATLVWLDSR